MHISAIKNFEVPTKATAHLLLPLPPQVGWWHDQHPIEVRSSVSQFGQNQACLNCLTKSHLVGDQQTLGARLQELKEGFELVGKEFRFRREKGIDLGAEIEGQLELRHEPRECLTSCEDAFPHHRGDVVRTRIALNILFRKDVGLSWPKEDWIPELPLASRGFARDRTDALPGTYDANLVAYLELRLRHFVSLISYGRRW